jgi:hypothetical protein
MAVSSCALSNFDIHARPLSVRGGVGGGVDLRALATTFASASEVLLPLLTLSSCFVPSVERIFQV